jgi:hypothetical protein
MTQPNNASPDIKSPAKGFPAVAIAMMTISHDQ